MFLTVHVSCYRSKATVLHETKEGEYRSTEVPYRSIVRNMGMILPLMWYHSHISPVLLYFIQNIEAIELSQQNVRVEDYSNDLLMK